MAMIHDAHGYWGTPLQKKYEWITLGNIPTSGTYSNLAVWYLLDLKYIKNQITVKKDSLRVKFKVTQKGYRYIKKTVRSVRQKITV